MRVLVTGAQGFIGKNLCLFLRENNYNVLEVNRDTSKEKIEALLTKSDFIFHLAGVNRPKDEKEFESGNVDLSKFIVNTITKIGKCLPIVLASSTQAEQDNAYGKSKFAAEEVIKSYSKNTGAQIYIYRFPNVFGKWCKPNYNSFVATFCYNILNEIDITINNPNSKVTLLYIDDLCDALIEHLEKDKPSGFCKVPVEYNTSVGEVAEILKSFKKNRTTLKTEQVGLGLKRALYSTYISYTQPKDFNYSIVSHHDDRGVFCEMLKTQDSGQFSFFTAHPGITRGGHYHNTKNEKFLVIRGEAKFKFENIITGERHQICTSGTKPEIVETIPGWAHDITNIGNNDLIVMLWANEVFEPERPDTFARQLYEED